MSSTIPFEETKTVHTEGADTLDDYKKEPIENAVT